jgi:hypothetical protein
MKITEALQSVVTALQGAGLTADTDTDKLRAPCAWVAADSLEQETLDGGGRLDLSIYLIAPDRKYAETLEILQGLLDQALQAVTPDGEIKLDEGVQTNAGVLPAFKIPLSVKVSI